MREQLELHSTCLTRMQHEMRVEVAVKLDQFVSRRRIDPQAGNFHHHKECAVCPVGIKSRTFTPGNVLVSNGGFAGVLDAEGLGPADPTLDLVGAWHLLDAGPRGLLRAGLPCDGLAWARGKAWAFE